MQWARSDVDADAAMQAAEEAFTAIVAICTDAGLVVSGLDCNDDQGYGYQRHEARSLELSAVSPSPSFDRRRISVSSWSSASAGDTVLSGASSNELQQGDARHYAQQRSEYPTQRACHDSGSKISPALAAGDEMVEVELTDLLTHSHEQVLGLQTAFDTRMNELERAREAHELKHAQEMKVLQEAVVGSQSAMEYMKQELIKHTACKLEEMQSATAASQKAIEMAMKEQAQYWKSICQELVAEKRVMAQKVAEERGKYTALKAHLASHDAASEAGPSCSTRQVESVSSHQLRGLTASPVLPRHLGCNEGGPENQDQHDQAAASLAGATPTDDAHCSLAMPSPPRPAFIRAAGSVRESSIAYASPTQSTTSSSKSSFRRYYLSAKGKASLELQ